MKSFRPVCLVALLLALALPGLGAASADAPSAKPSPEAILRQLQEGNARFVKGESARPNSDPGRVALSGKADQGNYAVATVLSCSDSRVPPELLFDVGVMDIFVVRVAGNVANTDEIGSIEYGMLHVNTPLLVLLGHTQCGAVTAVTAAVTGHGHPLERNIPPLVAPIIPAVKRTMAEHPELHDKPLAAKAIEENVWQGLRDIFLRSPAVRRAVKSGKAKAVGAIYDVASGKVAFLPEAKTAALLAEAESNPARAINAMAEAEPAHGDSAKAEKPAPATEKPAAPAEKPAPAADKPAAKPVSPEEALAARIKEIGAKIEAQGAEASAAIKDLRAKLDAASIETKAAIEARLKAVEARLETDKGLPGELKGVREGVDARVTSLEGRVGLLAGIGATLAVCLAVLLAYLLIRSGRLAARHEDLRKRTRDALRRIKEDMAR